MPLPEWVATRNKLQDMDQLIASGRGDTLVDGGGCTEPGGGIVPTQRTALEMANLLRGRMSTGLGRPGAPPAATGTVIGFGDPSAPATPAAPAEPSPWKHAVLTTVVSAVTGFVLEEIVRRTFRRKRR